MLYLLWALLNVGLLIFFIAICFRATKLLRENHGMLASIVFVFGLLSFMGNSNNNNNREHISNQMKTWSLTLNDSLNKNTTSLVTVTLEKSWISKYILNVDVAKDEQGRLHTPVNAYCTTTGLISGTNWKLMRVEVNKSKDENKFEYFVDGIVEWKLLGVTIYSQLKEYRGIISTM